MIQNYLTIALRTFHKNPVFSIINVAGLMIGLVSKSGLVAKSIVNNA